MGRMIYCPYCKRYCPFTQKDHKIYCGQCGREVTYSTKGDENVSPPEEENFTQQHEDSKSGGV